MVYFSLNLVKDVAKSVSNKYILVLPRYRSVSRTTISQEHVDYRSFVFVGYYRQPLVHKVLHTAKLETHKLSLRRGSSLEGRYKS